MIEIKNQDNETVSRRKNLRGITDYARKHGIAALSLATSIANGSGLLGVTFQDGARTRVIFADHNVMEAWALRLKRWMVTP